MDATRPFPAHIAPYSIEQVDASFIATVPGGVPGRSAAALADHPERSVMGASALRKDRPSPHILVVTFGCAVSADHYCVFLLFRRDGTNMGFGLWGGQSAIVPATPELDHYLVAVDSPAPESIDRCPAVLALGHFCKIEIVRRDYNQ